jgi:hypothetical protein
MSDTVPTLVATKNTTIKIRLTDEELTAWRFAAKEWDVSLSRWVRSKCNPVPVQQFQVDKVDQDSITVSLKVKDADIKANPVYSQLQGRKPCKHGMLFCKTCK